MDEPGDFPGAKAHVGTRHWYAFVSAQEMMRSIQKFMILRELDFRFTVYESNEHMIFPDGQVAFVKEKAVLKKTYLVSEFPYEEYF